MKTSNEIMQDNLDKLNKVLTPIEFCDDHCPMAKICDKLIDNGEDCICNILFDNNDD